MTDLTKVNVSNMCRTCLTLSDNMNFIHSSIRSLMQTVNIWHVPKHLADESEAGYPQKLCSPCLRTMEAFAALCQRAQESTDKLLSLFAETANVTMKTEMDTITANKLLQHNDTLMETESIMLDNVVLPAASAVNCEPDPFDSIMPAVLKSDSSDETEDRHAEAYDEDYSNTANIKRKCKSELKTLTLRAVRTPRATSKQLAEQKKTRIKNPKHKDPDDDDDSRNAAGAQPPKTGTKNIFKCTQCNRCFAHKLTLDAHVRKVHEGSKRPFKCDRCDKEYTFFGGLHTHIKEIHEALVRSYPCDFHGCDRVYTSYIAMKKHKRTKHSEHYEKRYVCEICGATFSQTGNLKYHHRRKHSVDDDDGVPATEKKDCDVLFECTLCAKTFHSRYTLKYHTMQRHLQDMKYECNVCGRRMAKKFMLMQHMLIHSTEKIPCEHCGKQFIRKFELEAHIRTVHMKLKPFECRYCRETFACRKTLVHHEYIHTGEKPYVCDVCGQAYRQQTCLKNHRKTHEKKASAPPQQQQQQQLASEQITLLKVRQ